MDQALRFAKPAQSSDVLEKALGKIGGGPEETGSRSAATRHNNALTMKMTNAVEHKTAARNV